MNEGNLKRYLIYAIGEIILVVLGILIALQINNWQQKQNNKELENQFYQDLHIELEKDALRLTFLTDFYNNRIENASWLLSAVNNPDQIKDDVEIGIHLEPLHYGAPPISYTATYESAKSSGHFNRFSENQIIKMLTQYYTDFNVLDNILGATQDLINNQFEPVLYGYPNYVSKVTGSNVIASTTSTSTEDFYSFIDGIKDNRENKGTLNDVFKDMRFENCLIGDLGRSFHALSIIKNRQLQLKSLLMEISIINTKDYN